MRVAITGATGFIGGRLAAAHMAQGDHVRLLTRRPKNGRAELIGEASWFQGDLCDPSTDLTGFLDGCEVLYHCAGEVRDVTRMTALHVEGTRRLIDAAAYRIGRWVQLSSVGAYGLRRDGTVTEETPLHPVGLYEQTKAAADGLVEEARQGGRIAATILRPSNVFGPDMPNNSVRQWIRMVRRGVFFFIGPPGASANYVPVESTVQALLLCGVHVSAVGGTFNVSEYASVEQLVGWIASECHVSPPRLRFPATPTRAAATIFGSLPGWPLSSSRVAALTTRVRYPQTKLEQLLGFRASMSLEDAVRTTVRACLGSNG